MRRAIFWEQRSQSDCKFFNSAEVLNFEIMEQLDAIRTERVAEYVIILQSYMRMLKPLLHYKRAKRCILRLQGFCKSWEIRRAYCEVRAAAKLLERWTRTYLAHQKLLDMRESDDPALTPDKKREALLKILYPAKHGRGRIGLSGKRRPLRIQPTRTVGDDADEDEFVEMPRFEVAYEGWLVCKVGQMGKYEKRYVSLKQGTLSLYVDHEALQVVHSLNMASCAVSLKSAAIEVRRADGAGLFLQKRRRFKASRWGGGDVVVFQRDSLAPEASEAWAEKLQASAGEARAVDGYKMQVSLDGDQDEKPVDQKVAAVIKEGYLRKKKEGTFGKWERRFFVLYNDGKLRYYESKAKAEEKGAVDLRWFALKEVEEEMEVAEDDTGESAGLRVQGQLFKVVKGKQFSLISGKHALYMASPERELCDEWIATLQQTLALLYQKSPFFNPEVLRVYMMDGSFTSIPLTENTHGRDVARFMCKKHGLNNETEWGLLELWDHPGIAGNMTERKLPGDELLLDQTLVNWERAARIRFGIISQVPASSFRLVMRKVTSLLPQARTKKEQQLEFCQAMSDLREGRFTSPDNSEIFDLAALAIFKDLKEGMTEEEQDDDLVLEEGQLTDQLHNYLPSHMFRALANKRRGLQDSMVEEWDRKVVRAFNELTRAELIETESMSEVRRIVQSFRMETELNAVAATRMCIERVRLAPLCFSAQYIAEMWSVDKILKVLVVINAGGLHVYRLGPSPVLISTFNFDTLVSWQSMNDMLIINIIYATKHDHNKRREKLRFLTREAIHMRNILTKYAEVVLANLVKRMRERDAMQREDDN